MKLNKKIFLIFLILLALIIPQNICADADMDLSDVNGTDMMIGDNCNLKLNDNNPISHENIGNSNSINEIGNIKNGISSDRVGSDLALGSSESTLDDESYFVSDNINSLGYKNSEESLSNDGYTRNNMLNKLIVADDESCLVINAHLAISDDESDLLINSPLKNSLREGTSYNIFIISDTVGNNLFDSAACEILDNSSFSNVKINIRSGSQITEMPEEELYDLMSSCDAFLGQWVISNVDAVLTNLLGKYPDLSDKGVFLILEPPTGNINSSSTSLNLVRNSTINHNKIFLNVANDDLVNYYKNTKRGGNFESISDYIDNYGDSFPDFFNNLVLYKDINDKSNLKNEILCTLNFLGYPCEYENPNFTGVQNSGIFRDRWYSLDEYVATFFNASNERTIGILESTMYIQSQQLDLVNSTKSLTLTRPVVTLEVLFMPKSTLVVAVIGLILS